MDSRSGQVGGREQTVEKVEKRDSNDEAKTNVGINLEFNIIWNQDDFEGKETVGIKMYHY